MGIKDGPLPPDQFFFRSAVYYITSPSVWRLINHLWNSPHRQATMDSLAEAVWGDPHHAISYLAVASLRRDSNRFFVKHNLPFQMRTKQDMVLLLNQPTVKESSNG